MKTILRWTFAILLASAIVAQPAIAYDYPLSSSAIRAAYFLGSGDPNKRIEYFEKYVKRYPVPKSGQYVASIRFETPYYVTAERVSQSVSNYFAQDAEKDYLGKPTVCRVRVEIYYGFDATQSGRVQMDYAVRLRQRGKEIPAKTHWIDGFVSSDDEGSANDGFYLTAEFDADDIDSEAPARVEVIAPDGRNIVDTFDLATLR